ncbi:hypothetical protein [Acidisphaera rubrifaciens]|uniref:hypothetical protein n=1 Tax=Acidisphaera rubrifaciens TaxID=50715 RepID=UPI0011DDBF6A|nr:hypothetical protein [Acidisphaera rubrifaciens]
MRLLDVPRLTAQLCALERRTARGGRDSIDHAPGAHDDLANAAAGALVQVLGDRVPALVRPADLLTDGAPVAPCRACEAIYAVAAIDAAGRVAIVTASRSLIGVGPPCLLIDFDVAPLSAAPFVELAATLTRLGAELRPVRGVLGVVLPPVLRSVAERAGLRVQVVDGLDPAVLALSAAAHVAAGRVKLSPTVAEKAKSSPFGASIELRAGMPVGDDPLRAAVVLAIVAALDVRE